MTRARPRHAFVVRDTAIVSPLEIPASELWFLRGPLFAEMQRRLGEFDLAVERVDSLEEAVARAAKCTDGALVTHDSIAFSRAVLRNFLAAAEREASPAIAAALPEAYATRTLSKIDGMMGIILSGKDAWTAPLYILRDGSSPSSAQPVLLPFQEQEWKLPTPPGMLGRTEEPYGATDSYLLRVDHWSHLLRLNTAALIAHWFEKWQSASGKLWFLFRALLGFPWSRGRLAKSLHQIHRKAKVHYSAHVELSVVEEGAEIGANAIVKNSYIARGARIDDGALVNACVIGEGAFVASSSTIFSCTLFPGAFAAQHKMQFCVLGKSSVAFTGSYFYDLNFDRNVQVAHRGRIVDSGSRFLSVCLGPHARVGGGVWIASGREVPAHALIVQPPALVAARIDSALVSSRMTSVKDGKLIDIGPLPPTAPSALPEK